MKKYHVIAVNDGRYTFSTKEKNPSVCEVWDMQFPEVGPKMTLQVDWLINSRYSKGRRKKMLRSAINSLLRRLTYDRKHNLI